MTAFVLVPGAGGAGWYWHRVAPLLVAAGHAAVVVDLPGPDPDAGLPEYAGLVAEAIGSRSDVVLVGMSMGAFPVAMMSGHPAVRMVVLVNAMVPLPGERPGEWWGIVGADAARREAARAGGWPEEFDVQSGFLHDLPPSVAAEGEAHQRDEAEAAFASVCDFAGWEGVPVRAVAGRDDRFFPVEFQRRLARERLGVEAVVIPGGHLAALSQPEALAAALLRF